MNVCDVSSGQALPEFFASVYYCARYAIKLVGGYRNLNKLAQLHEKIYNFTCHLTPRCQQAESGEENNKNFVRTASRDETKQKDRLKLL